MKKITSVLLTVITIMAVTGSAMAAKARYTYVTPKAPVITPALKPCILKYRQENYTGAMLDLEALLEKEKTNTYAQYYLALCYTKLGYEPEAKEMYNKIIEADKNESLTYYSKRALACIDDPKSDACIPQKTQVGSSETATEEDDDITKFIYSGKRIHPAAMDKIMKTRLDIKLEQDEYKNKQGAESDSYSYAMPTNEEIAAALDTLAKIGINPFSQPNMLSGADLFDYADTFANSPVNYRNENPDISQMLLYNRFSQQKNNFINYGI